ncbi:iron-containing alcohol dehydrogenase [Desulfosarcina sp.]|uniref:iron-containing alcohol dehydrogenase n=1 Tax=Desulfosarcina sp. TaxID=2027861 RepID=UPI0029A9A6CB|nr:iron-containing alcohol dehydrogenase [Desulfosarcina sp.]MDX2455709.1 iron-containing alcohol dehydrogenase [Desulfosarcina sp.]MDX2493182.1 iron-containing alcohol dehydrogenase [Desulfosarcina sp.]
MHVPGYYEFFCPVKTVAGHHALEKIPQLLNDLGAQRPMIITDKGVVAAGLVDTVSAAITPGIQMGALTDDVPPDSDLKVVVQLAGVYRESGCDAIIAVGGGSVMDTAKGVNILVSENTEDLMQFSGAGILARPLKPLMAIPTTAGTGSEVTQVAVIADHVRNLKMPFASYFLLPDLAVLDPRMTLTLPPAITAATAMDALTHAVEAYTCLAKNPLSDAHALLAIELIGQNLLNVLNEPENADGRLALAVASNLAGVAFSNAMVGMVHTLGHSVGAVCGVPHGACMAILLPYGLEYNMHKNGYLTAQLLLPLSGARVYAQTPAHLRAQQTVAAIRQLNQRLHQETGGRHARFFKEITGPDGSARVPVESLEAIADKALGDGSILCNPEELDRDDLLMVMSHAWAGKPLDRNLVKKGDLKIR